MELPADFSKVVLEYELKLSKYMLEEAKISKLLEYYSIAVSHYDQQNDEDTTRFYEHKIKQTLKLAAKAIEANSPRPVKNKQKVAQMKLELHIISKDTHKEDHSEEVKQQTQVYEENQKTIEIDFIKQDEKFRERLALRKKGKHGVRMLPKPEQNEWGEESTIKLDTTAKGLINQEKSVELSTSDINFDRHNR